MALIDSVLNLVNKKSKDHNIIKPPVGSRSEREAHIKDMAGMVITVFALLLSINTWYGGKLSSTAVLDNLPPYQVLILSSRANTVITMPAISFI